MGLHRDQPQLSGIDGQAVNVGATPPEAKAVGYQEELGAPLMPPQLDEASPIPRPPDNALADDAATLAGLEQIALGNNPKLSKLRQEYQAAVARSQYADKLPDPRIGANIFGNPIETAAGSQRANLALSQTIPWLSRLNAQQQKACVEALAIHAELEAERLRVVAGVRAAWYRLYIISRQIEIAEANQQFLKSLIEVANARVATGKASQGDVLLGTLELSQLEERLLTFRRQRSGVVAELNRQLGRPAATPVELPNAVAVGRFSMPCNEIIGISRSFQPEIRAAQLRNQASRWGVEVARLSRRPEFTLSASYFFTDNNRPPSTVVDVGEDPFAFGIQASLPIWKHDYDAMSNEARWQHQATQSALLEIYDRYDALVVDLCAEARRSAETASLYRDTILPQAQQTLEADQQAYANGSVEFDRVIRDYRNLLTLELGYHQAIGDLGIANAQLQRIAGQDFQIQKPVMPADPD